MQLVTVLRPQEPARFDAARLERLCREVGEQDAEVEVARALEDINAALERLMRMTAMEDLIRDPAPLDMVVAASDRIGMVSLSRIGRDVAFAASRGDAVTTAATLGRLLRVGERSIRAIWDLEDVSV